MAVFGAVQFRSEVRRATDNPDYASNYYFVSYMIYYPLVVIQFILHCFADKPPIFSEFPPAKVELIFLIYEKKNNIILEPVPGTSIVFAIKTAVFLV